MITACFRVQRIREYNVPYADEGFAENGGYIRASNSYSRQMVLQMSEEPKICIHLLTAEMIISNHPKHE